jgi:uncharacterized protein (TIGR03905 family)
MNNTVTKPEIIQYETTGTCCKVMNVAIADGVIQDAEFIGGCPGNLTAIQTLLKGMKIEDVISKFKGITCGAKATSCADQLATCLAQYLEQKQSAGV